MAGSRRTIDFNDAAILSNLTQANLRRTWASRRIVEDQLYLVHVQGTGGIGRPITVVVKKFQNVDGTVIGDIESRWKSEMVMLAFIRHENIIQVLHVIQREEAIMLVYEYAVKGSLDYWLHRREEHHRPLSWLERLRIAIGVAQGLHHMHEGCNKPVVHHNMNSTNILLDEQLNAKITSFGAAQISMAGLNQPLPIADLPAAAGNFGYTAPGTIFVRSVETSCLIVQLLSCPFTDWQLLIDELQNTGGRQPS
uniref:Uncharacterized protein n=1 Tax=Avena sativa TaxID=4498 RepID=A0ACD6AD42_AVESA